MTFSTPSTPSTRPAPSTWRTARRPRRIVATATAAIAAGSLVLSAVPALATSPDGKQTVDEAVAAALYRMDPAHVLRDDSAGTACMGGKPVPLTYSSDHIVVRTSDSKRSIRKHVTKALAAVASPGTVTKVKKIKLPPPARTTGATASRTAGLTGVAGVTIATKDDDQHVKIVAVSRQLRKTGLETSPDYLLSPTSGPTGMWPTGYPKPTGLVPTPRAAGLGADVDVWVYDTGVPSLAQGARAPHLSKLGPTDDEVLDAMNPVGVVDRYYGGHTLAIADVIATMAPGAYVRAARITDSRGIATDLSAATKMARTLRAAGVAGWPKLVVNAFGSPACDVDPADQTVDMVPLALQAVDEAITVHGGSVVVVSAGNRSTNQPFYPAAFAVDAATDAVTSVGAIDATRDSDGDAWTSKSRSAPAAWFSNYGPWVQLWAPGVDLSTRHVIGLRFTPTGPVLAGQALVSGTSFAAPYVAALLAEIVVSSGVDPLAARALLTASGMTCSAAIGSGTAVALTSMGDAATTPPPVGAPAEC